MFPDDFDAFWALWTPIWVLGHPLNRSGLRGGSGPWPFLGHLGWKITQKQKFQNMFGDTLRGY